MTAQYWTTEEIAELKTLWAKRANSTEIARKLHRTRESVDRKARRLKLPSRHFPITHNAARQEPIQAPPSHPAHIHQKSTVEPPALPTMAKTEPTYQKPQETKTAPEPKKILVPPIGKLKETCQWPIGTPRTPEFHFCGKTQTTDSPYCQFHYRMAYVPGSTAKV